jgi:hypothetical protein
MEMLVAKKIIGVFLVIFLFHTSAFGLCNDIKGVKFRSLEKAEIGLGPNGPGLGYWSIEFSSDGIFKWQHSDVWETGRFVCKDRIINAFISSGRKLSASYIPEKQRLLIWEGKEYRPVER